MMETMTAKQRGSELVAELRKALGDDAVLTEANDRAAYERGWRYGSGTALAVVRPTTPAEVADVLARATRAGVAVQPIGGNTGLVGASSPDDSGTMLVLSLERVKRVIDVDPISGTAVVDAGVTLSALQAALEPHGLWFPIDLGADPQVGGMVATNTGGTRLVRYGDVRANLLGVEVALADGTLVDRTAPLLKNNVGLDWKQLFVGTSGSFGVVTRATLRLAPRPAQRVAAFACLSSGAAAVALLAALRPVVGEVLSAYEVVSRAALEPVLAHGVYDRDPFGADGPPPYAVLVELSSALGPDVLDLEAALASALETHLESEAGAGVEDVLVGAAEEFWHLRHQVSECLAQVAKASGGRVVGLDVAVPPSRIADFTDAVRAELAHSDPDVRVCDFGHWGDGGTHLNLVFGACDEPEARAARLQTFVYDLCVGRFAGSFSAEHGVGPHNAAAYRRHVPVSVRRAARALGEHFDPDGLLGTVDLG